MRVQRQKQGKSEFCFVWRIRLAAGPLIELSLVVRSRRVRYCPERLAYALSAPAEN
jgi:hypothetical protein